MLRWGAQAALYLPMPPLDRLWTLTLFVCRAHRQADTTKNELRFAITDGAGHRHPWHVAVIRRKPVPLPACFAPVVRMGKHGDAIELTRLQTFLPSGVLRKQLALPPLGVHVVDLERACGMPDPSITEEELRVAHSKLAEAKDIQTLAEDGYGCPFIFIDADALRDSTEVCTLPAHGDASHAACLAAADNPPSTPPTCGRSCHCCCPFRRYSSATQSGCTERPSPSRMRAVARLPPHTLLFHTGGMTLCRLIRPGCSSRRCGATCASVRTSSASGEDPTAQLSPCRA